jgi:hypothetical protein
LVTRSNKLQRYAATRIASAPGCFAGICGSWQHHMRLTMIILGIHPPGQKIVPTSGPVDSGQKIDIPSPLERYFGRPRDNSFNYLTYLDYHSWYCADDHPISSNVRGDVCEPVRFADRENSPVSVSEM